MLPRVALLESDPTASIPFVDASIEHQEKNPALQKAEEQGANASTKKRRHTSIACGNGQEYSVGGPNQPERPFKFILAAE